MKHNFLLLSYVA